MIRDFSKEELEPADSERDTEFTLGGGTLFALGGGLLFLCVVCFGFGYRVGHRSSSDSATAVSPASNSKTASRPVGSGAKPGAAGQAEIRPLTQTASGVPAVSSGNSTSSTPVLSAAAREDAGSTEAHVKTALDPSVHPALGGEAGGAQPTSTLHVQPAMTQVEGWMVQIAAVSHSEDAEVLVNALRKRGYTVTARRDVGDSLIHVQTGPFVNRNDANAMRQKLLSDGYNAIVQ
ncbi:MAG: SPOR domain-containing protein [Terracidiphilus sp.]